MRGVRLEVGGVGGPALTLADDRGGCAVFGTGKPMLARRWYLVAATYDPAAGLITLVLAPTETYAYDDAGRDQQHHRHRPVWPQTPLTIAGWALDQERIAGHYNGKIDSPVILARALSSGELDGVFLRPMPAAIQGSLVVAFDFSREIPTDAGDGRRPLVHGEVVNLPARAMKGWNWTGEEHCWRRKPEHYGAIHFHDDDLYDAGWAERLSFTVPADMRSGAYAAHLEIEGSEGEADDGTVRTTSPSSSGRRAARRAQGRPKAAFLAPTCAYMAYANHRSTSRRGGRDGHGPAAGVQPTDVFRHEHAESAARSTTCHRRQGRLLLLAPAADAQHAPEIQLLGRRQRLGPVAVQCRHAPDRLARHEGLGFDVITDEDLHEEGLDALRRLPGGRDGHPPRILFDRDVGRDEGLARARRPADLPRRQRLVLAGRLAPGLPGVIEVRRAEDGIRTWAAHPGEYYHSFTGEFGGLWRRIGRPPNVMYGVGFIAQGFDVCSYYVRRRPRSARRVHLRGRRAGRTIGDFGLIGGGAAGLELDRIDPPWARRRTRCDWPLGKSHRLVTLVNEEFGVVPPNLGG